MNQSKKKTYILLMILIIIWGLDFIAAKMALGGIKPFTLVFIKLSLGVIILFILKTKKEKESKMNKKDIPVFVACAVGMIGYYGFAYYSMNYISVSLLSIMLATLPTASIIIESIFRKKGITPLMAIGSLASLLGVAVILGADFKALFQGKLMGYILSMGAVLAWSIYNFSTEKLHEQYSGVTLAFYQILICIIILSPYALTHLPAMNQINSFTFASILFQGIIVTGIGYLINVHALSRLGVTPTALFSNFLPVVTVILGCLIMHETISWVQIFGGILVVSAACAVIYDEGRVKNEKRYSYPSDVPNE